MTAMAFEYPDEIRQLRDGVEDFLRVEVIRRHEVHHELLENPHRKYTPEGRYVPEVLRLIGEVRQAAARAGYYSMCVPETLGGQGLGHLAWFAVWERIFQVCSAQYWLGEFAVAHWAFGPSVVLSHLTPEAQERHLPGLMAGETSMCFGMSEPDAGSDAMMMRSRAEPDGDGWRLYGRKMWTTNGPYADYCMVFAITDPVAAAARKGGVSAFLVPTTAQGVAVEKVIRVWGGAGGPEAELSFDGVRIEPYQLVGPLHKGFSIAMKGVNLGRLYNCARAVGYSRWALKRAFEYIPQRHTFGHPISEYQGVTFPLADSATKVHAAYLMALNAAQLLDAGVPTRMELSMSKLFATQIGVEALDRVMQAHGGMGMANEMHLTEAYALLRMVNIADGSNEILQRTIVKEILDGNVDAL